MSEGRVARKESMNVRIGGIEGEACPWWGCERVKRHERGISVRVDERKGREGRKEVVELEPFLPSLSCLGLTLRAV